MADSPSTSNDDSESLPSDHDSELSTPKTVLLDSDHDEPLPQLPQWPSVPESPNTPEDKSVPADKTETPVPIKDSSKVAIVEKDVNSHKKITG